MAVKTYPKGSKTKLSKNFKAYEFDCNGKGCCNETLIDEDFVKNKLQMIADHYGKATIINCGYRCPVHNANVKNASKNSKHMQGNAFDIRVPGVTPLEVAQYAESIGIKGIGLYDTFVHVDGRPSKSFWKGHKQIKVSTFGAKKKNAAVQKWQTAARKEGFRLDADGIWGAKSEAIAKKAVCKKGCAYSNLTKIIQSAVGVKADGKFGNDTRTAVKDWQKENGLTADGVFGLKSWKTLLGV